MIEILVQSPDCGETAIYDDLATALLAAQDEVDRWTLALHESGISDTDFNATANNAFLAPLNAWKEAVRDLNNFRRRASKDAEFSIQPMGLAFIDSVVGRALLNVIRHLGPVPAHFAAISARLQNGSLDWTDDNVLRGVLLYDRFKALLIDFNEEGHLKGPASRLDQVTLQIEQILESVSNLDSVVSTSLSRLDLRAKQNESALNTHQTETSEKLKSLQGFAQVIEDRISKRSSGQITKIDESIEQAEAKVAAWLTAQDEQRQLAIPAQLWKDRSTEHEALAKKWRSWAIVVGLSGLVLSAVISRLSFSLARSAFEDATLSPEKVGLHGAPVIRPTFVYELIFSGALSLVWLTMFLWAMRVLVRLYTTEHHLAIDASARSAMNETYLGLIAAQAATDKDRPIVLAALFRPVNDGMVKDDGPPSVAPAAILSGVLGSSHK